MPLKLHEQKNSLISTIEQRVSQPQLAREVYAYREKHTIVQKTVYFVGIKSRRAKSVLTTITIVVLKHLHLWTKY